MSMYAMTESVNEVRVRLENSEGFRRIAESAGPSVASALATPAGPGAKVLATAATTYVVNNHPNIFAKIAAVLVASVAMTFYFTLIAPIVAVVAIVAFGIESLVTSLLGKRPANSR